MTPKDRAEVVCAVAQDVITEIAPQELPVFRRTSQIFIEDPERALKLKKAKDDMLGFGLEEAASFLTPVVLAVAYDAVTFLMETLAESVKQEGAKAIRTAIKNKFTPTGSEPVKQTKDEQRLTAEELLLVRSRVMEKLSQIELPRTQATLIADSIVGSLVVRAPVGS